MKKLVIGFVALLLTAWIAPSWSEEIQEGVVLNKGNIDALLDKTLDGNKIRDLLLPSQEKLIREYNSEFTLAHAKPVPRLKEYEELTERFVDQVKFNPETRNIENYTTGAAFDQIDPKDPWAGEKVMINFSRTAWFADSFWLDPMNMLIIDAKRGVEREMGWIVARYLMTGRLTEPYVKDPKYTKYDLLLNIYPNDLKGLGLLTIQYTDGRLPDVYAYLKAVRRVRRLSSSAWADPLSGTVGFSDEPFGFNADPRWYKSWKITGKRKILAVAHGYLDTEKKGGGERFPYLKKEPPYFNFTQKYEPRDVWKVEAIPPDFHLIGKKEIYVEADPLVPMLHWQDGYDRAGNFWRSFSCMYHDQPNRADGMHGGPGISAIWWVDFKSEKALIIFNNPDWKIGDSSLAEQMFTPSNISRLAQ